MNEDKIILLVILGVFLYTSFSSLYGFVLSNTNEKEVVLIECYDKYDNEIVDLKCEEEQYIGVTKWEQTHIESRHGFLFLSIIGILMFCLIKFMRNTK